MTATKQAFWKLGVRLALNHLLWTTFRMPQLTEHDIVIERGNVPMLVAGLIVFLALIALAKVTTRLNICPLWLRQFRLNKYTLY
jgi:hypothetical protein